jgi:AcrR family transcriptional regulator
MTSRSPDSKVLARRPRTAHVRAALVEAAARVLERDGYAGLTVRAVATEANVAPMGIYTHLNGKEGLVTAAVTRGYDELAAAVAYRSNLPAEQALRVSGLAYRAFALAHPVTYGLMFGERLSNEVRGEIADHTEPAFEALSVVVRTSQSAGIIRSGDVRALALMIWSSIHGAISLELAQKLQPDQAEVVYGNLLTMIRCGLAPAPVPPKL